MLVETKARVGVFAIALGAYLPQFPSLVPEFEGQYAAFKKTIPDTVCDAAFVLAAVSAASSSSAPNTKYGISISVTSPLALTSFASSVKR